MIAGPTATTRIRCCTVCILSDRCAFAQGIFGRRCPARWYGWHRLGPGGDDEEDDKEDDEEADEDGEHE